MPSVQRQLEVALNGITQGDMGLLQKVLMFPESITPNESRSVAEQFGHRDGFLNMVTDLALDPTVWASLWLSRRFPTSQYLRGAIPQRFVGASNEFSGLSSVARTVEGFFRGTHIPGLVGLKMRREAEVLKIGNRMFDRISHRPNWKNEMEIVSSLLEGQTPSGATPGLKGLATSIRNDMDEIWKLLGKTLKVEGGFQSDGVSRVTSRSFTQAESPRYLRDYLPHIPLLGPDSTLEISGREALKRFGRNKRGQAIALGRQNPAEVWQLDNTDRLSSDFARWQNFMDKVGPQVFNPRLFRRRRQLTLSSSEGRELFVTDLNVILQKYIHSAARTYSLNAPLTPRERALLSIPDPRNPGRQIQPGPEPIIQQVINQGLDATGGRFTRRQVLGTNIFEERLDPSSVNAPTLGALKSLTRNLKGQAEMDEVLFGNLFNSIRSKVSNSLGRAMSRKQQVQLEGAISSVQQQQNNRNITNRITSFFYATTLGLNPLSSLKNLFQPFLTTAPAIGIGPTLEGFSVLRRRLPQYARNFSHEFNLLKTNRNLPFPGKANLALEKAYARTFPELAKTGVRFDPRAYEIDETALVTDAFGKSRWKSYDDYMKFLLQTFTQTEASNQVVSFYGAKSALRRATRQGLVDVPEGVLLDDFLDFRAADTVRATQFTPGPGSRTQLQSMIPAPFRMFTSFPVRLANFFSESTVRGAMSDRQLQDAGFLTRLLGGRNYGTVARTFLAGRVISEGLRETLGVDMGDAVGLTGPFSNIVPSGQLIPVLPMSPLPSLAFGLASYAATRDIKELQPVELPVMGEIHVPKTLLPGGIQITRMSRALRSYRPDIGGFVDDNERLMFRGDTTDLVLSMLGIPLEKERREKQILEELSANRMLARDIRRQYAVSVRNFDTVGMSRLERRWQEAFPDFGPLGLSRHDLRRYNQQSRVTSVQRMLRTLGKDARFLESEIYETDPDLIVPRLP